VFLFDIICCCYFDRLLLVRLSDYQLEREGDEPGQFVNLDASLDSTGTLTFTLVKTTNCKLTHIRCFPLVIY